MAFDENLEQIRKRGLHYLVAGLQTREKPVGSNELENDEGWENIVRIPSRASVSEKDARGNQTPTEGRRSVHLCRSDGRKRQRPRHSRKAETKLIADLQKLQQRVAKGRLKRITKSSGRSAGLQERYPRVAR